MNPISIQQQFLDATVPGRYEYREMLAEYAPDHILQHFIDRIRINDNVAENTFLNWVANNVSFFIRDADDANLVWAQNIETLEAIVYTSDLIQHFWQFSYQPKNFYKFINATTEDLTTLWEIPFSEEAIRTRVIALAIFKATPVTKSNFIEMTEYIQNNKEMISELLERIIDQGLNTVAEIQQFASIHRSMREGML
jgi:hypothetical protein